MTRSGAIPEQLLVMHRHAAATRTTHARRAPRARHAAALRRAARVMLAGACALGFAGCYSFSGNSGGLPKNLRTVAVQPFDNQTASPELQRELLEQVRKAMQERLSLREAPEARADVVVRGVITRYDVDLPAGVSADPRTTSSTRRRLQLAIDVEIIDQTSGKLLFKRTGLTRDGQYVEGAEATGRRNAIEGLVNELIEGTQSQW